MRLQAASDVYSPVSGEVLEVNGALVDKPATVSAASQPHSPKAQKRGPRRHGHDTCDAGTCCPTCVLSDTPHGLPARAPHTARLRPLQVNASPYADGWLIKMKMSKKDEMSSLLDAATYKKECN